MVAWRALGLMGLLVLSLSVVLGPSAAWAGQRVTLELVDGDRVVGELLRRDAKQVVLMVGGQVVDFPAASVVRIEGEKKATAAPEALRKFRLYTTGRHPAKDMQGLVEELGPAIAVVKTPSGLGTGWFCNRDGYLVTNHHVIAGERTIRVTVFPKQGKSLGRKVFKKVRIVALNAEMDLALLRVEEPMGLDLPQLILGDSRAVKVGDRAFAIGNPLGLERSTSQGIVSKVGRNIGGRLFIQTTAPIAPGNSGGPLFNQRGEVIGMVSRGAVLLDGLGFAIPAEYVKEFLDNLEAFAYDEDNPNTGITYMETPVSSTDGKLRFDASEFVRVGHGLCCLNIADLGRDGISEVVFANNNKSEIGLLRYRKAKAGKPETEQSDWDINQLPDSQRFKLETVPVTSRVSSIAVGDLNGDGLRDIVFFGDRDGLSVLEGKKAGGFAPVRKIDDVPASGHQRAIRIADLDGNKRQDIFVLGRDLFTIFWDGKQRETYPLESFLRSKVKQFDLVDADRDGLLDLVFFVTSGHYGAHLRRQSKPRCFSEGLPLRAQVSGPVEPLKAPGGRFVTLDVGINRVRELRLSKADQSISRAFHSLAVESGDAGGAQVDLLDLDNDGRQEMLAVDQRSSEYMLIDYKKGHFVSSRSPAPASPLSFRMHRGKSGKPVVFSYSRADHLFGVSPVRRGSVAFPRPIHTQGPVQWMQLERVEGIDEGDDERAVLLWAEKSGAGQVLRLAEADRVAAAAYEGREGSLDVSSRSLTFGPDAKHQQARLSGKIKRLAFADFNGDDKLDLVLFWAYSSKESLYLGLGGGRFAEVDKRQGLVEDDSRQSLLIEDLDGDGRREVLQVQPGFIRVFRVDPKGRLYIQRQLNWEHGRIRGIAKYSTSRGGSQLIVLGERQARIVRYDKGLASLVPVDRVDLTGIELDHLKIGDLDGDRRPDLVGWSKGVVQVLLARPGQQGLTSRIVLNASLNHFSYFKLVSADLDGDGRDEIILFDKRKAAMEILRSDDKGAYKTVFRHRLFTAHLSKRAKSGNASGGQPREVGVGDVNGDGRPDLVFVLHDRVAIYLQGAK